MSLKAVGCKNYCCCFIGVIDALTNFEVLLHYLIHKTLPQLHYKLELVVDTDQPQEHDASPTAYLEQVIVFYLYLSFPKKKWNCKL